MCPSLNNEMVCFNSIGFKHLIRKAEKRTFREQRFRFSLLPFAPMIIFDADVIVNYRFSNNKHGKITQFWGINKTYRNIVLRVIIRQIGCGQKHFYSIMKCSTKNPS